MKWFSYILLIAFTVSLMGCNGDSPTQHPSAPPVPDDLRAYVISETQAELRWSRVNAVFSGYIIEVSFNDTLSFIEHEHVSAYQDDFMLEGLSPYTTYWFRIRSYNDFEESEPSSEVKVSTHNAPPAAASGLRATVMFGTEVHLSWVDNAISEDHYRVLEWEGDNEDYTLAARLDSNVTEVVLYDRLEETEYSYLVYAKRDDVISEPSNMVTATTSVAPLDFALMPLDGVARAPVSTNFYLEGRLTNHNGTEVGGRRVNLSATPEESSSITRWSYTEPEAENGFNSRVVFLGREPGIFIITGKVKHENGSIVAEDSLHVEVYQE